MAATEDLKYSKDHEWVRVDSEGVATIGVTAFAASIASTSGLSDWFA